MNSDIVLGVSVYPDLRPLDEIEDYLRLASKYGFTRVFTSMFSMEGTSKEVLDCFAELDRVAHECGMRVSLDINPECMARLGATPGDLAVFNAIEADILRMDGAYGEDDNALMLANPYGMQIEYNASALSPSAIESLVARGIDKERILACHNFYPERYTGMRWDRFCEVNERLSALGIRIGSFVASQNPGTHGVWDAICGLPTVEAFRNYPADLQARLQAAAGATDIFFGNAYASEQELAAVAEALSRVQPSYERPGALAAAEDLAHFEGIGVNQFEQRKLRVEPLYDLSDVEREILFDYYPHVDMGDGSEWIWRTRMERIVFAGETIAPRRYPGSEFQPGDVLIVNDNYRHYAGEVHVVREPIINDGTHNLVARIDHEEMRMLKLIEPGQAVVFLPVRG